ncbi:MAG: hydrogenase maturation protease [Nanobdellota archaeon]
MEKIAVIGYGSFIRNDDALGLTATDMLNEKFKDYKNLEFFYGFTCVDLLAEFENFNKLYIIDSAMLGKNPGEFVRASIDEIEFSNDKAFSHSANFNELIKLADGLGFKKPDIIFYMVQPKNMEMGETIEEEVKKGMLEVVDLIEKEINESLCKNY